MESNQERSIIVRPDFQIEKSVDGESRIVVAMVNEILAVARPESQQLQKRFNIGAYEWCEPDYRQIMIWAKALALEPETVIERLAGEKACRYPAWGGTRFHNGRMTALHWNLDQLPLESFDWVNGLGIQTLSIAGKSHGRARVEKLDLPIAALRHLYCVNIGLLELDLRHSPRLQTIDCSWNEITDLELSTTSDLKWLNCDSTSITDLDLSSVPKLEVLFCGSSKLSALSLASLQNLRFLSCTGTPLTKLELAGVTNLRVLDCQASLFDSLDLSAVRFLQKLSCSYSSIAHLDLALVPELSLLWCEHTKISELDIRPLFRLKELLYDMGSVRLNSRPNQASEILFHPANQSITVPLTPLL